MHIQRDSLEHHRRNGGLLADLPAPLPLPQAVFKIVGNTKNFPKTRREYIAWGDEDNDGSRSERFLRPAEPYTQPVKTKE